MEVRKLIVSVPVANIRAARIPSKNDYKYDEIQETQVLYGERLALLEEKKDWYRIEAIEQPEYTHNKFWQGYPGWIEKRMVTAVDEYPKRNAVLKEKNVPVYDNHHDSSTLKMVLSIGARLYVHKNNKVAGWHEVELIDGTTGWIADDQYNFISDKPIVSETVLRKKILNTAEKFLGDRYLWGGTSGHIPNSESKGINVVHKGKKSWNYRIATGVDCSGLAGLSYRVNGINLPRDAHEQWMKSHKISRRELKPGDLVFLAKKDKPGYMTHVMLYYDKEKLIESPESYNKVQIISFNDKLGKLMIDIEDGDNVGEYYVYYGRYIES